MFSYKQETLQIIAELKQRTHSDKAVLRGVAKTDTITYAYDFYEKQIIDFLNRVRGSKSHVYEKITKQVGPVFGVIGPDTRYIKPGEFKPLMEYICSTIIDHNQILYHISMEKENDIRFNVIELAYYPEGWRNYFNVGNKQLIPINKPPVNYKSYLSDEKLHKIPLVKLTPEERLIDEQQRITDLIKKNAITKESKIIGFYGLDFGPTPDIELVMQSAVKIMTEIKSNGQLKYQIYIKDNHPVMEIKYYPDGQGLYN